MPAKKKTSKSRSTKSTRSSRSARSTKRSSSRRKKNSNSSGAFTLLAIASFVIFVLYLGAKVQVEEVLRETSELTQEKLYLERKVNDLNLEINGLKSYERISRLAKKQGLVPVESSDLEKLPVDFDGLSYFNIDPQKDLYHAGMWPR